MGSALDPSLSTAQNPLWVLTINANLMVSTQGGFCAVRRLGQALSPLFNHLFALIVKTLEM